MSIRWKFLFVVLVFSVVPLLAVITLSQWGTVRLGETISELMDNILTQSAGAELTQTTAASARILEIHLARIEANLSRAPERASSSSSRAAYAESPLRRNPPLGTNPGPPEGEDLAEFVIPGSLRLESAAAGQDDRHFGWGRPQARPGSRDIVVRLAAPLASAGHGPQRAAHVDVALSYLLEASVLNSRWSIRMQSYLVAREAADASANGLTVLAARDSLEDRGRWRPGRDGETLLAGDSADLPQVRERLARGDTGFIETARLNPKAVWAFAPVGRQWAIVNITPGLVVDVASDVLAFARWQWIDTAAASLVVLLVLVAIAFWRSKAMTAPFQQMVQAVEALGRGDFAARMALGTGDERDQVARAFNDMIPQLEDRLKIRKALDVAQEIQQTLLPPNDMEIPGFAVSARSVYSDETGGDYFDFFPCGSDECARYGFVVGDVTGHGVGAALLMATARAFVRAQMELPGEPAARIGRVNQLLTADTRQSGNFMSLFYLEIDLGPRSLRWVRAGHDPALLYDPARGVFEALDGPGLVLGVDKDFSYAQFERPAVDPGTVLLLGTDGIWEAHDPAGAPFGKERFQDVVRAHAGRSAREIRDAVLTAVRDFRGALPMEDDMTLIVIKAS
jgi:sigma-B regulation protein RsbU (phosphoserine phosphatase)